MDAFEQLFSTFKIAAEVFHNGQYCGDWAIDTSGSHKMPFHLVTHGACYLTLGNDSDEEVCLHAGDLVLFPKDAVHCLSNQSQFQGEVNTAVSLDYQHGVRDDGTGLVCGYFSHQHPLIHTLTEHLPPYILLRQADVQHSAVNAIFEAMVNESRRAGPVSGVVLSRLSEALLALVFRDHLPVESGILAAFLHPKLGAAMHAIHQQPQTKWTVESLADKAFMSRAAFSDLFKSVVGQSPMDYVTQWRLSVAYRLLSDEGASTLQAALACGYDNESSFSKACKRVLGLRPGEIRASSGQPDAGPADVH